MITNLVMSIVRRMIIRRQTIGIGVQNNVRTGIWLIHSIQIEILEARRRFLANYDDNVRQQSHGPNPSPIPGPPLSETPLQTPMCPCRAPSWGLGVPL